MKRAAPWENVEELSSDSDSDKNDCSMVGSSRKGNNVARSKDVSSENGAGVLIRRAAIYQEYMKSISLPSNREAIIPFNTWQGLAKSMKQLYEQPLHYLTNVLVKQWDQGRVGTDDYHEPLDSIIHPFKASTAIWAVEEVHRLTLSHEHLAKLWAADPMYPAFLDPTPSCPKEMKIV